MNTRNKMKTIKVIKLVLLTLYGILLPIYLGLILPEYLACRKCTSEGAIGIDIWGSPVQCFGDSKVFSEALFQFSSVLVAGLSALLMVLFFLIYYLNRSIKMEEKFLACDDKKYS